jgi:hypothetical protein
MSTFAGGKPKESQPAAVDLTSGPQPREDDAIYQNGRVVARVADPQVDSETKEIRFAELYNSDELLLPDECEFQKYTIMVQRIAHATKVDKGALHKGRVLRDVVAEILGYREQ